MCSKLNGCISFDLIKLGRKCIYKMRYYMLYFIILIQYLQLD